MWAHAADAAYQQIHGDLGLFNRKIYVLPLPYIGYWGQLSLPGGSSRAWVADICNAPRTFWAHEFGHNLGMLHAAEPNGSGMIIDYGDGGDVMGSPIDLPRFNAPHAIKRGLDPHRTRRGRQPRELVHAGSVRSR